MRYIIRCWTQDFPPRKGHKGSLQPGDPKWMPLRFVSKILFPTTNAFATQNLSNMFLQRRVHFLSENLQIFKKSSDLHLTQWNLIVKKIPCGKHQCHQFLVSAFRVQREKCVLSVLNSIFRFRLVKGFANPIGLLHKKHQSLQLTHTNSERNTDAIT